MAVFVFDKRKQPLMPCSEKRARLLLTRGRALVVKHYPFTIRLKDRIGGETQPLRVKLDPGSRYTGIALVREDKEKLTVLKMKKEIEKLFIDKDSSVKYIHNAIAGLMMNKTPVIVDKEEYNNDTVTISLRLPDASSLDDYDAILLGDMFSSLFNEWLNPHKFNISMVFEGHPLTPNLLAEMEFFINEINYRESLSDCKTISNKARDFFGINWGDSYKCIFIT